MAHPVSDSALPDMSGRSVSRNGRKLTVVSGPVQDGNRVSFVVLVTRGGKNVTPPDLNPVRITGSPLLVPDALLADLSELLP